MPLTDGMETSKFFHMVANRGVKLSGQKLDYWDRIFIKAERVAEAEPSDRSINEKGNDAGNAAGNEESISLRAEMLEMLCKLVIGRDKNILSLALSHFQLEDLLEIKGKMIGSGYIGGKAVGMLLARKILKDWKDKLEPHDSFYIGSDVFYTYIVQNGWWKLRLEQRTPNG